MTLPIRHVPAERKARPPEHDLGFGRFFTDHLFAADWDGRGWTDARVVPYGPIALDPAAAVLHYGQEIFEGMKAFRGVDGKVRLFRPFDHARRFMRSAELVSMPAYPPEAFVAGVAAVVRADRDWVPSKAETSLYIRPTMIATEPFLGVRVSERHLCYVVLSPAGGYYGPAGLVPLKLWVERHYTRAAQGGLGAAKTGANYVASLRAASEAKARGYAQVLWLDAREHRWVEEAGTMNVFVRLGDTLVTPPLEGTILAGITRDSVLAIARGWGLAVEERPIAIDEIVAAGRTGTLQEVFGTGTAAVIAPVGELGLGDARVKVGTGGVGELSRRLYDEILGIQTGRLPDTRGWLVDLDAV